MKLSAFGKFIRKYRIEKDIILKDMANSLGVSSAFLSAVETGKKTLPADFLHRLSAIYSFSTTEKKELESVLDESVTQAIIPMPKDDLDRRLVGAFSRNFQNMDEKHKIEFLKLLDGDNK